MGKCIQCGKDSGPHGLYCDKCARSPQTHTTGSSHYSTGQRLAAFISSLGWVLLVISILSIFVLGSEIGIAGAIGGVYGAIASLFLVAAGQMMGATLDTANNTMQIANLLKAQQAKE